MPGIKPKRKIPTIDMTAMVDIGFLLLTFFILTTKFKAEEKVAVDTPLSSYSIPVAEGDMFTLTVADDGRIFIDAGDQHTRSAMLDAMERAHNFKASPAGRKFFLNQGAFGVPLRQMSAWLNQPNAETMKNFPQPGIPVDTRPRRVNELREWISAARHFDKYRRFAIKGDQDVSYTHMDKIIYTLQDVKVDKFNLITNLESDPSLAQPH